MKKLFFLFVFLLITSLSAEETKPRILAWEAVKKDLPGHLTLAGSLHLGKKDFYPLDSAYDFFWEKAEVLVLEVVDTDGNTILPFLRDTAFYRPGEKDLSFHCGSLFYRKLLLFTRSFYPPHLFNEEEFKKKRPWFLSMQLAQMQLSRLDYKLEYGMEELFRRNAGNRELRGLENTLFQLSTLEKIPEKEYLKALEETVNNPGKELREFKEMIFAWQKGELAPLKKLTLRQKKEYPILHRKLLVERNRNMAEKLAIFSKEKKRFFVLIGSAHFAGENSILSFLREMGFTVKRIPAAGKKGKLFPVGQAK